MHGAFIWKCVFKIQTPHSLAGLLFLTLKKEDVAWMYAMMISFHLLPNLPGNISGFDSVMCLF